MTSKQAVPELLIAAGSPEQIERYVAAGADAVLIGEPRFAMRLPGAIAAERLAEAVALAHRLGARAYVAVNKLFRNAELAALPEYLRLVRDAGADAAVFGDPAVPYALREYGIDLPLHWNGEMTGTNSQAAAFWKRHGAVRAVLARELNGEEIRQFARRAGMETQVQVHGATNIYHAYRQLLQHYMTHTGREARLQDLGPERGLCLVETERPDQLFPVFEDENGTHVMSAEDLCLIEVLPELIDAGVTSLYIEPLLKSETYNEAALRAYRAALDAWAADPAAYAFREEWLEPVLALQDPHRELGFGFYYKEQVY